MKHIKQQKAESKKNYKLFSQYVGKAIQYYRLKKRLSESDLDKLMKRRKGWTHKLETKGMNLRMDALETLGEHFGIPFYSILVTAEDMMLGRPIKRYNLK